MKLTVKNLGRIESAELDIKPLTVFFGPNGTNKTWTVMALVELLRPFSTGLTLNPRRPPTAPEVPAAVVEAVQPLFKALRSTESNIIAEAVIEVRTALGELLVEPLETHADSPFLAATIGLPVRGMRGAEAAVSLISTELDTQLRRVRVVLTKALASLKLIAEWDGPSGPEMRERTLFLNKVSEEEILHAVEYALFQVFRLVLPLPAERGGLLAMMEVLNVSELSIPDASVQFLTMLRGARGARPQSTALTNAARGVLAGLLQGTVDFVGDGPTSELAFRLKGAGDLPIRAASSLVRTLAGFSLYLSRFAAPGDVLLIDELEMNAHPEAQLALTELMALLVHHGIRVVFTTHSPYVLDHINNLMEASRVPVNKREEAAKRFVLKTPDAFIPTERVAAYAFEEKGGKVVVRNAIRDDYKIISGSTFGDASDMALNTYSEMLEINRLAVADEGAKYK